MDLNGVERVDFRAFGGADTVTVDDLTGTDADDRQRRPERVRRRRRRAGRHRHRATAPTAPTTSTSAPTPDDALVVDGLAAQVRVAGSEPALDNVDVATLGGADTITAGVGVTGPAAVNVDGGDGDRHRDATTGTAADDTIGIARNGTAVGARSRPRRAVNTSAVESLVVIGLGGADTIAGQNGIGTLTHAHDRRRRAATTPCAAATAPTRCSAAPATTTSTATSAPTPRSLGGGDDRFQWDPGDGSDTVEGQGGDDALDFNGSNIGEKIDVAANGSRVRLTRDVAAIAMDFDDVERVSVRALGGTDTVTVDDLAGTGVKTADVDLGASTATATPRPTPSPPGHRRGRPRRHRRRGAAEVLVAGLSARGAGRGRRVVLDNMNVTTLGGADTITSGVGAVRPRGHQRRRR